MVNYNEKGRSSCDPCGILCIIFVYIAISYSDYAFLNFIIFYEQKRNLIFFLFTLYKYLIWIRQNSDNSSAWKFFVGFIYQLIIVLTLWSHAKASYCDPGVVQKPTHNLDFSGDRLLVENELSDVDKSDNWSICTKCETYRPPRAHHCRICQRCIIKMDHHCPWINNCVGELNQKFFLQFLFYVGVMCCVTVVSILVEFVGQTTGNQSQIRAIHCIVLLIESLLFGIFVIAIFTDQLQVLTTNETAIDRYKNIRRKRPQTIRKKSSMKEICGKGPIFLWILPITIKNTKRFENFIA